MGGASKEFSFSDDLVRLLFERNLEWEIIKAKVRNLSLKPVSAAKRDIREYLGSETINTIAALAQEGHEEIIAEGRFPKGVESVLEDALHVPRMPDARADDFYTGLAREVIDWANYHKIVPEGEQIVGPDYLTIRTEILAPDWARVGEGR